MENFCDIDIPYVYHSGKSFVKTSLRVRNPDTSVMESYSLAVLQFVTITCINVSFVNNLSEHLSLESAVPMKHNKYNVPDIFKTSVLLYCELLYNLVLMSDVLHYYTTCEDKL